MISNGFPNVTTSDQQYNIGEKPSVLVLALDSVVFGPTLRDRLNPHLSL